MKEAASDIIAGLKLWPLWSRLAWRDIQTRYQRSVLGPLWITLSMGVLVVALGLLYGVLLKTELRTYFPFVTLGLITWGLISGLINESVFVLVENAGIIKQLKLPYSVYVFRMVLRHFIIFAHNLLIFVVVKFVFDVPLHLGPLLVWPFGLFLVFANGVWFSLLVGSIATRFRDLQQVVVSALQVIFYVTPVVWPRSALGSEMRYVFAELNPFAHVVELVRGPLMGEFPPAETWYCVGGLAALGWAVTLVFLWKKQMRIAFWVS